MTKIEPTAVPLRGPVKRRILLIDDSAVALTLFADALRRADYDVLAVRYPFENKESLTLLLARARPDLVLCDVDMPQMQGSDFVRIIKANPLLRGRRVYFYSSMPDEKLEALTASSRADGYIRKSDDFAGAVRRVSEILGR